MERPLASEYLFINVAACCSSGAPVPEKAGIVLITGGSARRNARTVARTRALYVIPRVTSGLGARAPSPPRFGTRPPRISISASRPTRDDDRRRALFGAS